MFAEINPLIWLWILLCLAHYKLPKIFAQAKAFGERNPQTRDAAAKFQIG